MPARSALILFALVPATLALAACAARAQAPSKDPTQLIYGRRLAQHYCGECHAIEPGARSPLEGAPRFPELYRSYPIEQLAGDLPERMTPTHPHMSNMALGADEVSAIMAYLASFRPPPGPAPKSN